MKTNARSKFIAMLLVLSLILTGFPGTAVWAQAGGADQTEQAAAALSEQPVSQAQPAQEAETFQLDADCKLLNYVHAEVFAQNDHVARMKEEETLSSYVFQNRDGSRTAYFLDDNVKFVDTDGITKEKDITLVSAKGGYSTRQNNVKLLLPNDPASGIRMQYDGHTVTLIPQGGTLRTAPQLVNNSVRYGGYFGENTSLNYTPTLAGLKEDIVLSTYTGVNAFTFTMNTGGLNLYQAGEKYYLAESKLAEERIHLNEIEVYDANHKPYRGTLTAKTVMPGQRYEITVSVSEEYLTDPTTVYPVTIDPSLEISDAIGPDAIEDAPIYEGYPNSNFGSYIFNRAGYAGSDYGVGRTVVRLPGLFYSSYADCDASDVESVMFYISEGNGDSSRTVRLHSLSSNSTWTESTVTWNSIGSSYGSAWDYANMSYGNYACFDITELAWEWKLGDINEWCGFLLKGANETSVDTVMLSSEYSSRRPYVVADYWSAEPADPPSMDPKVTLNITTRSMSPGETHTLISSVTPPGSATVSWSSSNSSVASVDSSGKITAHRLGQATITASVGTEPATCDVTVQIPDGVYCIDNISAALRLGTSGSIAEGTDATLQYATAADPARAFQLWKITHIENGVCYSIRPLNKQSMGLSSESTSAEIESISESDSASALQAYQKWYLSGSWTDGFLLKAGNSNAKYLQPDGDFASVGTSVITDSYDDLSVDVDKYYWDLEQVTGVSGVLLYENNTPVLTGTLITKYMVKGETKSFGDLGFAVSSYSTSSGALDVNWSSTGSGISVTSSGEITATAVGGNYTVTGTNQYGQVSFNVYVIPLADGDYYISNCESRMHVKYNNGSLFQDEFKNEDLQMWTLTHLGSGRYSIRLKGSDPGVYWGINGTSAYSGQSIVPQSSITGWIIEESELRPNRFTIKSSGSNSLYIMLDDPVAGHSLLLGAYHPNSDDHLDEWTIAKPGAEVALVGVLESADKPHYERTSALYKSMSYLQDYGYEGFTIIKGNPVSKASVISALSSAKVFISRSHGGIDEQEGGTRICLTHDTETTDPNMWLSASDIYDFESEQAVIDLSGCDIVMFIACKTAAHETQSLLHAAVKAGADCAIGFSDEIPFDSANNWLLAFMNAYYEEGENLQSIIANLSVIGINPDVVMIMTPNGFIERSEDP